MAKRRGSSNFTIGVDLGGTNVRAGLVDRDRLLKLDSRPIRSHGTKEEVFEDLCAVISAVIDERVRGIGLGVPSLVDPETGIIHDTTNIPSWTQVPLKKWLEKKFKKPVRLNNDANCFALGERYFGHGRGCENFVGLITGTGLGAGIIAKGRLHSGVLCGAGEFGLIPYRSGILEHYASGQYFRKFNREGAELSAAAAKGDPQALNIYNEYGAHLGHAIKLVLYALAPEMIVLGGSVSRAFPYYKKSLFGALGNFAYQSEVKRLKLKVSRVGNVAVLGAASLIYDEDVRTS